MDNEYKNDNNYSGSDVPDVTRSNDESNDAKSLTSEAIEYCNLASIDYKAIKNKTDSDITESGNASEMVDNNHTDISEKPAEDISATCECNITQRMPSEENPEAGSYAVKSADYRNPDIAADTQGKEPTEDEKKLKNLEDKIKEKEKLLDILQKNCANKYNELQKIDKDISDKTCFLSQIVRQNLEEVQSEFRNERENDLRALVTEQENKRIRNQDIQKKMVDGINSLQSAMVNEINKMENDFIRQMESVVSQQMKDSRNKMFSYTELWKKALFNSKYEQLAKCYCTLYRYVNVDKPVNEEIKNLIENTESVQLPESVKSLKKIEDKMLRLLNMFTSALADLDLYPFIPERGTLFDSVYHISNSDLDIDPTGKEITSVLEPGIEYRINNESEAEIIRCATVYVSEE